MKLFHFYNNLVANGLKKFHQKMCILQHVETSFNLITLTLVSHMNTEGKR